MRALATGPAVQAHIDKLVAYADAHRLSLKDIKRIQKHPEQAAGSRPEFRVLVPMGFRCVFTIEEQPEGWMRHLSVSVDTPGKYPHETALQQLGKMFGFKTPFGEWFKYLEEDVYAVNMLEKL